ncbi:hypothetical protein AU196_07395 [Mycobacterium sp. IS-1742]|uniref:hypothetical protein n=1 Tax=Mycobacterium sp. IS-1742 TaxID=1772285 RepID=UPI00073FCAD3|nr:hypothetical protein [Mycobacterium sp. IS-1742]KUI25100.1 hypothetical protein AU196_07395 [Mycobacterium sp. IS-1742]
MTTTATAHTSRRIQSAMGLLMLIVGIVGTVAPQRLSNTSAPTKGERAGAAERNHLTQMYAMREAALGAILLGGGGARPALGATVGLTAAEVITGLRSPALDRRSRITTAVTASLFGTAAAYALTGVGGPR